MTLAFAGYLLLGFCLLLSFGNSSAHLLVWDEMPYGTGILPGLRHVPKARILPVLLGGSVLLPAIACFTFGWGLRALWAVVIFVGIGLYRRVEIRTWEGDTVTRLGKYAPGAVAVLGWLIGWSCSSGEPELVRQRMGAEVACGLLAGAMAMTGIRKIEVGSWKWFGNSGLPLMLAERLHIGPVPLRWLRAQFLRQIGAVNLLGGLTVGLEVLGVLYAIPALRFPATIGLVIAVVGIMVLLGYAEFEWLLVYIALAMLAGGLPMPSGPL